MKRIFLIVLLIAVPGLAGYLMWRSLPFLAYNRLVQGRWSHALYQLPRWDPLFLAPKEPIELSEPSDDFSGLWRQFHLRDVVVPLPAGHPLFHVLPMVKEIPGKPEPQLGLVFTVPTGRELARTYFLPSGAWNDQFNAQGLFRLPLVRKVLRGKTTQELWRDIFTKKIHGWDLPLEEMAYNLYLVHMRSHMLPVGALNYGLLADQSRAVVELPSANRDYRTEIVFQYDEGLILTYLLVTERASVDARDLRTRFLQQISFRASDPALAPLVYREFKQLSFNRQVGQEGMLYLFSAWSHALDDMEMFKEMIYFLERGGSNGRQLRPLYRYAMTRYHKTFTTRDVGLDEDDEDIRLQRLIELEGITEHRKLMDQPVQAKGPEKVLTPEERMDEYLRQARERKAEKPGPRSRQKLVIP